MAKASDLWPIVAPLLRSFSATPNRFTTNTATTVSSYSTPVVFNNAWSSSNGLNTARSGLASVGNATTAICFGGFVAADSAVAEVRNGGVWTATGALNTARQGLGGAGTTVAVLSFGGYVSGTASAVTEKWTGSSWVNVSSPALTARGDIAGVGLQNAALSFGGWTTGIVATVESFNGTVWSAAAGSLNTARYYGSGVGVQNSALSFGGYSSGPTESNVVESWNGSAWTAISSLPFAQAECAASGVKGAALVFGSSTLATTQTSFYSGSAWYALSSPLTPRKRLAGCGGASLGFSVGGRIAAGTNSAVCESFAGPKTVSFETITNVSTSSANDAPTITSSFPLSVPAFAAVSLETALIYGYSNSAGNEVTDLTTLDRTPTDPATTLSAAYSLHAWATGNTISTARYLHAAFGFQNAMVIVSGETSPSGPTYTGVGEYHNGSSWSSITGGNQISALVGAGVANAGLYFGGRSGAFSSYSVQSATAKYNGVSWASGGNLSQARYDLSGAGCVNAALSVGGRSGTSGGTYYTNTEQYNGTSWSSGGALPAAKCAHGGTGITNAALAVAGYNGSNMNTTTLYNGSTWTTSGTYPFSVAWVGCGGRQGSAVGMGDQGGGSNCKIFNGSAWSTFNGLPAAGLYDLAASSTNFSAPIAIAGFNSVAVATTYPLRYGSSSGSLTGVIYGITNYNGVWAGAHSISAAVTS